MIEYKDTNTSTERGWIHGIIRMPVAIELERYGSSTHSYGCLTAFRPYSIIVMMAIV